MWGDYMLSKKKLIVMVVCVVVIIMAIIITNLVMSYYSQRKTDRSAVEHAKIFTEKWLNYSNQSDNTYLESIKPLTTDKFFKGYTSAISSIQKITTFKASAPTSSAYTNSSANIQSKNGSQYEMLVVGQQKISGTGDYKQIKVIVNISKDNNWLVSNAYIK